jgi:hypothetical protein
MRTAEEILEKAYEKIISKQKLKLTVQVIMGMESHSLIVSAINEARKEAIEECAEKAEVDSVFRCVDKQSILNLINELK